MHLKDPTATPLVQREQDAQFTSKFITANPDVKSLSDLKGKSFAFGSISSTSGSLMPRYFMLKQDNIKPEEYFSRVAYSGAHDATVAWVQAGKVEGGVLNASVWQKLVDAGKVDTTKVKVFATTPTYFDYNWTVRGNMDPALKQKIKKASWTLTRATRSTRRSWTCRPPAASSRPSLRTTRAPNKLHARPACSSDSFECGNPSSRCQPAPWPGTRA